MTINRMIRFFRYNKLASFVVQQEKENIQRLNTFLFKQSQNTFQNDNLLKSPNNNHQHLEAFNQL